MAGEGFGPFEARISPEKVSEYITATGDDPRRWGNEAPPSYAGALLFTAAPWFLQDERVVPYTGILVHVDQRFTWRAPLTIGLPLTVRGSVDRVRSRGGRYWVTFSATVRTRDEPVLDAVATFLMGAGGPPESEAAPEPAVGEREANQRPSTIHLTPGMELPPLAKSASRLDLVRYAGASGDFNPVHFDHDAARNAGLPGVVVHGLLMGAWAMQLAAAGSPCPQPLDSIRLRFRNPLAPGAAAVVSGVVESIAEDGRDATVALRVGTAGADLVTGSAVVRLSGE